MQAMDQIILVPDCSVALDSFTLPAAAIPHARPPPPGISCASSCGCPVRMVLPLPRSRRHSSERQCSQLSKSCRSLCGTAATTKSGRSTLRYFTGMNPTAPLPHPSPSHFCPQLPLLPLSSPSPTPATLLRAVPLLRLAILLLGCWLGLGSLS